MKRATPEVVAITGALNFLGQGLTRRLIEDDRVARIVAIDTRNPTQSHPKIVYHKIDLTSPASTQRLVQLFKTERVASLIHLVFTYTLSRNRALAHELEAIGTMHVLDACSEARIKRIVARSTTAIYGARAGLPDFLAENYPLAEPRHDSFISDKIELERQMLQYGREHPECGVALLRDCTSLGSNSMNYLVSLLRAPRSPRVMGFDPLMQFIHEEDLFRAYHLALQSDAEGVFNIVGKGVVRYSEAIRRSGGCELALPETMLRMGTSLFWHLKLYDIPPVYIDHLKYAWVADGTKAMRQLGFLPQMDVFEVLKEMKSLRRAPASRENDRPPA